MSDRERNSKGSSSADDWIVGLRVLDWTNESGSLAGKILADLGADVIKIEPPGGDRPSRHGPFWGGGEDPEKSLSWLAQNTSKRGIVIDRDTETGRQEYRKLVSTSDVVLETFAPGELDSRGIGYAALGPRYPALIHCAITPFGQTGPYAHYRAGDLVVVAMGGNMAATGEPGRPPLRPSLPSSYFHAGPEAVLAVFMALFERERTGKGQFIDVSLHEVQLQTLLGGPGQYPLTERLPERAGARLGRTREIWAALDGMVSYGLRGGPARIPNLQATVAWMDECEMASAWLLEFDWTRYSHLEVSSEDLAKIETEFEAFFVSKTVRELYSTALDRRILLAPCNDAREIVDHEQLRARQFFTRVAGSTGADSVEQPDFFAKFRNARVAIRRPAPGIAQHQAEVFREAVEREERPPPGRPAAPRTGGIFEGLRVLEVGSGAAGPVATRYFAEHGAHVIRIESGVRPDFLRVLFLTKESRFGVDGSPMFVLLNGNKDSVTLNLKRPEARTLAKKLVTWADVLCENYAPGVMEKFGLGYDRVRELNPDLVMASGCLFGQTGPQRSYPGFGAQGSAISGFNHITGWPDGPAVGPYGTITDSLAPRFVALSIAAALWRKSRVGEGEYIDVSQIETAVYCLSEMVVRYSATGEILTRRGNRSEQAAPHGVYPCAGKDRWIAIEVEEDESWQSLVATMGNPVWIERGGLETQAARRNNEAALDGYIAEWTRGFEPYDLMHRLQSVGVAAGVVQNFRDLLQDPQLAHREHWVRIVHSNLGPLDFERSGFRFSGGSGRFDRPGPNLGEHNGKVFAEIVGLAESEIEKLVEQGIIA